MSKSARLIMEQSRLGRQFPENEAYTYLLNKFCGTVENPVVENPIVASSKFEGDLSSLVVAGYGNPGNQFGKGLTRRVDKAGYSIHAVSSLGHVHLVSTSSFLSKDANDIIKYLEGLRSGDGTGRGHADNIDETYRLTARKRGDVTSLAEGYAYFLSKKTSLDCFVSNVTKSDYGKYYGDVTLIFSRVIGSGSKLISPELSIAQIPTTEQALSSKGHGLSTLKGVVEVEKYTLDKICREQLKDTKHQTVLTVKNIM